MLFWDRLKSLNSGLNAVLAKNASLTFLQFTFSCRIVSSSTGYFESRPSRTYLAYFCALTIWLLVLLAVNPQLHATLHPDSDHSNHTCAVTLFSHGLENSIGNSCLPSVPLFFAAGIQLVQRVFPVAEVLYRLPPGRGPPLR